MPALARFLGLAFAAADLLIEIDETHRVVFAAGGKSGGLVGRPLAELISPADRPKLQAALNGLRAGERRGSEPMEFVMPDGAIRPGTLSAFALPELKPNVSCAVTFTGEAHAAAPKAPVDPAAFQGAVKDLLELAASGGKELSLALVEIKGLIEARRTLSPENMAALHGKIQALMARYGADGATTNLTEDRFAIVHERPNDLGLLLTAIGQLGEKADDVPLEAIGQTVMLSPDRDPLHNFRAVRIALDSFISSGLPTDEESLRRNFLATLDDTARSAGRLNEIIDERRFELYFQPVVDLATEAAIHHEVLVRFEKDGDPSPQIKLAEDLAVIERLDAAVMEQAVRRLRAPGMERLKLAVNVSGGTLLSDVFLERLLAATNVAPGLRSRLQLEITESAALQDLEAAGRRIRGLNEAGFHVSIDDFGAGAASFDYLRALPVSAVKIDGRYIRGIDRHERAQAIVKHLVGLCAELKFTTIAEMIEREEELLVVSSLGVACGQGWLFGRPEPEPRAPLRKPAVRARRMGEREQWG